MIVTEEQKLATALITGSFFTLFFKLVGLLSVLCCISAIILTIGEVGVIRVKQQTLYICRLVIFC